MVPTRYDHNGDAYCWVDRESARIIDDFTYKKQDLVWFDDLEGQQYLLVHGTSQALGKICLHDAEGQLWARTPVNLWNEWLRDLPGEPRLHRDTKIIACYCGHIAPFRPNSGVIVEPIGSFTRRVHCAPVTHGDGRYRVLITPEGHSVRSR